MSTHAPATRQPPTTSGSASRHRAVLTGLSLTSIAVTLLSIRWTRTLRRRLRDAVHEARHDPLTGLPNRSAALAHLATEPVGMLGLLDLDHFKDVNDRYGHDVGDHLLIAVATGLQEGIGERGTIARLAGDEFLILWTRRPIHPIPEARAVLLQATAPVSIRGHHIQPAASLGLALPGPHLGGEDLLAAADHAMYEAKYEATTTPGVHLYTQPGPPAPITRATSARRSLRPNGPVPEQDTAGAPRARS